MKIGKKHELIYREIEPKEAETETATEGEEEDNEVKSKKKGLFAKVALGVAATGAAIGGGIAAYKAYKKKDEDDGHISVTTDDPDVASKIIEAAFGDSDDSKEEQTEDEDN